MVKVESAPRHYCHNKGYDNLLNKMFFTLVRALSSSFMGHIDLGAQKLRLAEEGYIGRVDVCVE